MRRRLPFAFATRLCSCTLLVLVVLASSSTASAAGPTIRGRVLLPDGSPAAGARVFTQPRTEAVSTDTAGRFLIDSMPGGPLRPGRYVLLVAKPGFAQARVPVELGSGGLDVGDVRLAASRRSEEATAVARPAAPPTDEDAKKPAEPEAPSVGAPAVPGALGGGEAGRPDPTSGAVGFRSSGEETRFSVATRGRLGARGSGRAGGSRATASVGGKRAEAERRVSPKPKAPRKPSGSRAPRPTASTPPPAPPMAAEGEGESYDAPPPSPGPRSGEFPPRTRPKPVAARRPTARRPPKAPGVKAGSADDNKQFNHYLDYLRRFAGLPQLKLDVSNRLRFKAVDSAGRALANCRFVFRHPSGRVLQERRSYSDGRVHFYPSEEESFTVQGVQLQAECLGQRRKLAVDPNGRREVEVRFGKARPEPQRVPLDVAFLLDTTGSMGDEIERLRATLEAIHFQIAHLDSKPDVRFGMVLYRDRGDDYRTRVVPFTADVERFQKALDRVEAGGGGDGPEDLQEGLRRTLQDLEWRSDGVRLAFLLADAQPHLDYGQDFTYIKGMQQAAREGIKVISIGASGLPPAGEIVFRQIAQYTQGLFVFLTYGESGESDGGTSASVSHHTGSNWQSRDLDAIVVQMVRRELSHRTERPYTDGEEYYEVDPKAPERDGDTLVAELFEKGLGQLLKYSSIALRERTPTVILPVAAKGRGLKAVAETIEDRLILAAAKVPTFQVVERRDAQKVMDELRRSGSDMFDSHGSARVGRMLGAELAIISRLRAKRDTVEVFVKLVRVETGEVLAVSLMKVPAKLVR